jgi:hypothetical protein
VFDMAVQPFAGYEPHGVVSIGKNGEPGGRPAAGLAKGKTNPLTRKMVEIAHRGEGFAPALDGFDPTGTTSKCLR